MYYQIKGLVLNSQISNEADKTLTLFTHEWGKISVVVPGAKKIKAKFSAISEPVTESEFMVYSSRPTARPKVTGARMLNAFPELRADWRRFAAAQYCAEICDSLTPFNAENFKKYELLLRVWHLIGHAKFPWRIFLAFALRFLKLSGYSFLEYLRKEQHFVPAKEQRAIELLSVLSGDDIDDIIDFSPDLEKDVRRYLDNYLNLYVSRPLAAREFWHKINIADKKIAARSY